MSAGRRRACSEVRLLDPRRPPRRCASPADPFPQGLRAPRRSVLRPGGSPRPSSEECALPARRPRARRRRPRPVTAPRHGPGSRPPEHRAGFMGPSSLVKTSTTDCRRRRGLRPLIDNNDGRRRASGRASGAASVSPPWKDASGNAHVPMYTFPCGSHQMNRMRPEREAAAGPGGACQLRPTIGAAHRSSPCAPSTMMPLGRLHEEVGSTSPAWNMTQQGPDLSTSDRDRIDRAVVRRGEQSIRCARRYEEG